MTTPIIPVRPTSFAYEQDLSVAIGEASFYLLLLPGVVVATVVYLWRARRAPSIREGVK